MTFITINGIPVPTEADDTILRAARRAEIYIPTLCYHPALPPGKGGRPIDAVYRGDARIDNRPDKTPEGGIAGGCGLCVVEMLDTGELQPACLTPVASGTAVTTESEKVKETRRERLAEILALHPHACLTCAQHEGCSRTQCSSNVPENERCCPRFGNCELQKVSEYVGISGSTPKWAPTSLPILDADPLLTRNYNLCISCTRCVRACRDLRGIEAIGFVFDENGNVTVGSVAPGLKDSGCKFCTSCVEVCPTGAIVHRGGRISRRREAPFPFEAHILAFTAENVQKVPAAEGAFRLMDETKMVVLIKGTDNMRELLEEYLEELENAKFFDYEEDKMFSKRESELVQQHLQKYGQMPSGGGEEDDLF